MLRGRLGDEVALVLTPTLLTILVFISIYFQGLPLSPKSSLGQSVETVPHFVEENGKEISLPKRWRINLITGNKLDKNRDRIRAICGECNNLDSIRMALEHKFSVDLMCGPSVKNKKTRDGIAELVDMYPDKFSVYILKKRPIRHATILGNNILLESLHEFDKPYDKAVLIENANYVHISRFNAKFDQMLPDNKATRSDVECMGLYEK